MTPAARIGLLLALAFAATAVGAAGQLPPVAKNARIPVLIELFTSEGCSSCPPADAVLRRLLAEQPIDGIEIVGLGHHVDYWDRLGWRDAFSSALFSARQSAYSADVFRAESVYTPQMIVDGRLQSVGSDETAVRRNILSAARQPKALIALSATAMADATLRVNVRVDIPDEIKRTRTADLVMAVTEDNLTTRVQRGENHDRTLAHSAVVRVLKDIGKIGVKDQTATVVSVLKLQKDWNPSHLRLVAFVQEQASHRVVGTSAAMLSSTFAPGQ